MYKKLIYKKISTILVLLSLLILTSCNSKKKRESFDDSKIQTLSIFARYQVFTYQGGKTIDFYFLGDEFCYNPPKSYPAYDYDESFTEGTITAYVYNLDKTKLLHRIKGKSETKSINSLSVSLVFHIPYKEGDILVEIKNSKGKLLEKRRYVTTKGLVFNDGIETYDPFEKDVGDQDILFFDKIPEGLATHYAYTKTLCKYITRQPLL